MLILDSDAVELRKWIIKKLEALEAVADEDVLADFVIALLRTDSPETQLRQDAYQDLEDFLKENTKNLVDDVFTALQTRSYIPGYVPAAVTTPSPYAALPKPVRSSVPVATSGSGQGALQGTRKRSFNEAQENGNELDMHYARGDRQIKQMRRGGRGRGGNSRGRGGHSDAPDTKSLGYGNDFNVPMQLSNGPMEEYPQIPFDMSDPFAAMAAFQAMGLPGMPQMPQMSPTNSTGKTRCPDYDTVGFCARGNACPYQHGPDHMVFPNQDEYDPKNAMLMDTLSASPTNGHTHTNGSNGRSRGSGRGRGDRGGSITRRNNRADFSLAGPNNDRSNTTIVVEQIPEEKFDEQSVRDFFMEFGNISEVTMQPYKRLALVKYDDYSAARKAYESPKVIFDNRFVKVYWYKPGSLLPPNTAKRSVSSPTAATTEEEPFDREEFEKKAQEAQKKLEEKKAQMKEMDAKRAALEKQKEELAHRQAEEKKRLLERLAAKGGHTPDADAPVLDAQTNGNDSASASTKLLRAKLAELEEEAKSLGIDHSTNEAYPSRGRGRGRGRGSYRGWEGFAGRGTYDPYRGSPRGRGSFRGYGGGKYNLDLRTKKVCVSGVEWNSERDEALRQFLLGVGEFEAITPHPKSSNLIITFKDRPTAESFFYGSKEIPSIGKLEFTWYNAPVSSAAPSHVGKQSGTPDAANGGDGDVGMTGIAADDAGEGMNGNDEERALGASGDVDYDVAEEDDRWS